MTTPNDDAEVRVRIEPVDVVIDKIVQEPVYRKEIKKVPVPRHNIITQDRVISKPVIKKVPVEVPQPHYQKKEVEIPRIKYVDVPVHQEYKVPRIEVKVVHEEVQVPGSIYHVPKPVTRELKETVFRFVDNEVPVNTGAFVQPSVDESTDYKQVEKVKKYVPKMVPIEIYLPVPVQRKLRLAESCEELRGKTLPAAQFNAQIKALNPNIPEEHLMNLYQRLPDGSIPTAATTLPLDQQVQGQHHQQSQQPSHNQPGHPQTTIHTLSS